MTQGDLPAGWVTTTLGEICDKPEYGWTTKAITDKSGLKLLRTTDISKGPIDWSAVPFCEQEPPSPRKFLLSDGDIVISRAGSVGLSALISNCPNAVFASYLIRFRTKSDLEKKYLHYYLSSPSYWEQILQESAGIALQNVNAKKLSGITIPLSPLAEQRRIVAEIETQFTRLDASVTVLRRAQANLKRYRASVLKAACEGRLVPTEAELTRSEGRDYEPAAVLLERILAERRARWESREKRRGKYKKPSALDTSALPELPEGWAWAVIEQLLARSEYGTSVKCSYEATGLPVLRIPNIVAGEIDLTDIKYATQPVKIDSETSLAKGDVLMCRTNGSVRLVGKTAMVHSDLEPYHGFASYLLRFRLMETEFIPKWFHIYSTSQLGRAFIEQNAASSAGQNNVSLSLIHTMPIPLPPLAEQRRIVAEVERRLSVVQQTEATVEASLARAERLRQSILKQAFSGKLVPQDPDDDPASALLERIRAEREAQALASGSGKGKSGRRRTRKVTA